MQLLPIPRATVAPTNTFHLSKHHDLKDTILVQTSQNHDYVNDSEPHEENPHLGDFLKPSKPESLNKYLDTTASTHETTQIPSSSQTRPSLPRPKRSCLHNQDCESRRPCEDVEARRSVKFKEVTLREYGKTELAKDYLVDTLYLNDSPLTQRLLLFGFK